MTFGGCPSASSDEPIAAVPPDQNQRVALREAALDESSGLALSRRSPDRFWSHNDSGGKPKVYAFDSGGEKTGQCELLSVDADDWEDMASFVQDETPRLLIADCGDNRSRRRSFRLYLLDEPDPNRSTKTADYHALTVTYSDGPRDCEAVAVDPIRDRIVLISKTPLPAAGIYLVPLPKAGDTAIKQQQVGARRVGTLPIPMISAMDLDPITGDLWVVNYFQAFRFACRDRNEPIERQLARTPVAYELPRLRQIEAAAVERGSLWVTSEGSPTWMERVDITPAADPPSRP